MERQFVKMCVVEFARNYVFSVGISQLSEGGEEDLKLVGILLHTFRAWCFGFYAVKSQELDLAWLHLTHDLFPFSS